MRIGPISEDDDEVSSVIETVDDGDDDDGPEEPSAPMNWPRAAVAIVSILATAFMWHDCFGR